MDDLCTELNYAPMTHTDGQKSGFMRQFVEPTHIPTLTIA